ncbi:NAD(P)H-quinone oxidoreductase [Phytomonospora endophytica]|uniref:Putative PIG3 family NAD(P)H quinone oxidoreductase n=1 Tax=Phytomonospora endophytica TaxID=714109 RepID=A0A841FT25_9ACTN|nr:NAD(P)H-quinone oxidoreductase [Phytomonospora endophytica]MBB6035130.1 putative PIG3 family NAD(P)H quinone oxidoreductase [Phytomonospora endophytica]GIG64122.1 NAD(P)H quinone oxidoreductase [Phytomonospora endophytica]
MRAVVASEPGGPEVLAWTEVPDAVAGAGEVLIRVAAAGVNRADLLQRQGHYPPPAGAPSYPGLECSGTIVEVGDGVTRWRTGDEVCALLSGGGYAELVAVDAGLVMSVPSGVSTVDAAGLPEVAATVWSNVFAAAALAAGETFLVHGGGGGIGTFAIQLAVARTARVFTTARSESHERLRALGAEVAIDYREGRFADIVRELGGADVILDNMGAAYLAPNIDALAPDGRIVVIGMQGGRKGDLDLGRLMAKRGTIHAAGLRARPLRQRVSIVADVESQVWPHIADGTVAPVVDTHIPMSEASEAHARMERGGHVGKILLTTG